MHWLDSTSVVISCIVLYDVTFKLVPFYRRGFSLGAFVFTIIVLRSVHGWPRYLVRCSELDLHLTWVMTVRTPVCGTFGKILHGGFIQLHEPLFEFVFALVLSHLKPGDPLRCAFV